MLDKLKLRIIIKLLSSLSDKRKEEFRMFVMDYLGFTIIRPEDIQDLLEVATISEDKNEYH